MTVPDALADGRLDDALTLQLDVVASRPTDPTARLHLFELQSLAGLWRPALDTLAAVTSDDPGWPRMHRWYRRVIRAARHRQLGRRPTLLHDCPSHVAHRWKAGKAERRGDAETCTKALDRADHRTPHLYGHIDGREFEGLRDADDRFAAVLEVFVGSTYVWLPWEQLRRVVIPPAEHLFHHAFRPVRVRWTDGSEFSAVLPLVYPGSEDGWRLGTATDHIESHGLTRCTGGKLLLTTEEEIRLSEARQIDVIGWV